MARNGEVKIDVTAEASQAKREFDAVGGKITGIGDKAQDVQNRGGGLFAMLKQGFGLGVGLGLIQQGIGAIGGLADGIIGGAAEFERYNTQFTVLLGSSEAAKQRLDDLAKFGQTTPFELPEIVKADKVLTSFGIESQKQLQLVGDAAAGTGTKIDELSLTFGKISAGAFGEAFQRLAELGIATRKDLEMQGLKFDKSGSFKGTAEEAMAAVNAIVEKKFGGMMDKQSQTLEGQWSNVQDTINGILRDIGTTALPVFKSILAGLLQVLTQLRPIFDGIMSALQPVLSIVLQVWDAVMQLVGGFVSGKSATDGMTASFGMFGPAIDAILKAFNGVSSAFDAFLNEIGPPLNEFMSFLGTTVLPALSSAFAWLGEKVLPPIVETISALASAVLPILAAAFKMIVRVVMDNWPTISAIAGMIGNAVQTAVEVIRNVIVAVAPVIRWLAETIFPILGTAAGSVLQAIRIAFETIGTIWRVASALAEKIVKHISDSWNRLTGVFETVMKGITGIVKGAANILIGIVNGIIDAVNSIQVHIGRIGLDTPAGFVGVGPFDWNGLQLAKLPYLAKGAWNIPDQLTAVLHPGEMVLPRDVANLVRAQSSARSLVPMPSFAGAGGSAPVMVSIVNHFGPSSVRSNEDIRQISREQADRMALLGFTGTARSVGGIR